MAFPAKKKGPPSVDLAVIMGGPAKGKAPMGDEPEGDEMEMDSEEGESSGAFDVAFEEFNDPSLSADERKAAFKRAVMACQEEY